MNLKLINYFTLEDIGLSNLCLISMEMILFVVLFPDVLTGSYIVEVHDDWNRFELLLVQV